MRRASSPSCRISTAPGPSPSRASANSSPRSSASTTRSRRVSASTTCRWSASTRGSTRPAKSRAAYADWARGSCSCPGSGSSKWPGASPEGGACSATSNSGGATLREAFRKEIDAMWDALWRNGKVATMTEGTPFGLIEQGAIAIQDGRISWVGPESALPSRPSDGARAVHNLGGRLLTPGLVDPHNHAVYYGDALADFELLTQGGSRADMIASGGGVGGLVRQTRAASDEQIRSASAARFRKLIAGGITTLESKSGAGPDLETELRCLRISREMGRTLPATVVT